MNYLEALAFMEQRKKYGSRPGLDCIRELLYRLGEPQKQLRRRMLCIDRRRKEVPSVIQIAGTNGKGSVGAFMAQILTEAGYRVGRFTSPAVFCERETISINGEMISEASYAAGMTKIARKVALMDAEEMHPTAFEIETALALLYLTSQKCDLLLMEAGMGGALDATNVFADNLAAVITSVSLDHTAFLGNTLEEITAQKVGLAHAGGILVTQRQTPAVCNVMQAYCREKKIRLFRSIASVHKDSLIITASKLISGENAEPLPSDAANDMLSVPLNEIGPAGDFQQENAALAVTAVKTLASAGITVGDEVILNGLAHTKWRGRFEKLQSSPDFWIDGAHNPDAAKRLAETLHSIYGSQKVIFILGMFRDKDIASVCSYLLPCAKQIYTVSLAPPRGLAAQELRDRLSEAIEAREAMPGVTACESLYDALKFTVRRASADDVIVAAGSLSYLGELTKEYNRMT